MAKTASWERSKTMSNGPCKACLVRLKEILKIIQYDQFM
jgi:hypothetical protein